MRKIVVIGLIILCLIGCDINRENNKITLIGANYPCYDFIRAITKNSPNIDIKMLTSPGMDLHDYEPTPKDIIDIKNSNLFVYVGGESDEWLNEIIDDIDLNKINTIKLMDIVNVLPEEVVEGMEVIENEHEEEEEYDEHVWTSPINVITIINKLKDMIIEIDPVNKTLYEMNANNYINELNEIDGEIRDIVANSKRKEIIFGDRFPFRYFVSEYGLSYYAAFPGCSDQTEASAKTISFLIDKVKNDNIPVVYHLELSNPRIAKTISEATGAKILEFNSAHNITLEMFNSGITYVDIMKKNIEVLKEGLN